MKKICAITMVRNDAFFLRRWVSWYGSQLGRDNLFVLLDGADQRVEATLEGIHVEVLEHVDVTADVPERRRRAAADRARIDILSARAAELLKRYDLVIGTDVDEFLAVDPALGMTLCQFLSDVPVGCSLSALGMDVGQHLHEEAALDESRPFFRQRRYALISDRYSKASVLAQPVAWGSGFHRVRGKNFHIVSGLYLFHFGSVDSHRLKARLSDKELMQNGWGGHLRRRMHTINVITHSSPRAWEVTVERARHIENIFRQPYAWNKPTLLRRQWVVEIPERFRTLM